MTKPRRSSSIPAGRSREKRTTAPPLRDGDAHTEDRELIKRLVRGDANAWQQFVVKYQRLVLSRIRNTMAQFGRESDHALAEDICADAFALLLANDCAQLQRFEGRSKLSTWLDVVTRRICLRKLSRVSKQSARIVGNADLETVAGPAGDDPTVDDTRDLKLAMSQLSGPDRQVLELFYFEHRTYAQIATDLQLSINTVGPKLKRAQQRLRKILTSDKTRTDTR